MKLSNKPVRGTADWPPEEFRIRKYIFDTWRKTCRSFGYEEYLTPIIENAEIYRAKSGDELGNKQLLIFTTAKGEDLAIRPEMTPSVTRMLSGYYNGASKPIRLFSIANFWRNEKPQKGRNREFWQLNIDIFGESSIYADIEILTAGIQIMLDFKATEKMFTVMINNRILIDDFIIKVLKVGSESTRKKLFKLIDKWPKLTKETQDYELSETLKLSAQQIKDIKKFTSLKDEQDFAREFPSITESQGYQQIINILDVLQQINFKRYVKFIPSIIRGIDYYDGLVFECFDSNPDNNRALFGGGRYNGLSSIFGIDNMPAVGFGFGDETMKLFLQTWNLLQDIPENTLYYIPILDSSLYPYVIQIANYLRQQNKQVITDTSVRSVSKALKIADRLKYNFTIIAGSEEKQQQIFKIKNMISGKETIEELPQ